MKLKWLNRTLVLGPALTLCLSEAEYEAAKKHVGWKDNDTWCHPESARVHMEFDSPNPVAIVCYDTTADNTISAAGALAHEATHIWQEWCRSMGEDAPGDEISAYAVQNLVVLLMDELARRRP